jgi:prepilin-type N-terminal cleavage/methylation domain-containing protein
VSRLSTRRRTGFTLIELLVVIAIIAVLIALLLPAVQKVREASARSSCQNNLKQLGLGMNHYHETNGGYPPEQTTNPQNSWTPYMLPFIEQENLARLYRLDLGLVGNDDTRHNSAAPAAATGANVHRVPGFLCPSAPLSTQRIGQFNREVRDYSATATIPVPNAFLLQQPPTDSTNVGVLGIDVSRRITDITDGSSNTLLLAEDAGKTGHWQMGTFISLGIGNGAWAANSTSIKLRGFNAATMSQPGPCAINCENNDEIYSFHSGGANVVCADGSVHFLSASTNINIVAALITRAGGESISPNPL